VGALTKAHPEPHQRCEYEMGSFVNRFSPFVLDDHISSGLTY